MASYQETVTSDESINELIAETTGINHLEVIENVIDSLEQDDSAMVSHTPEGGYLWKFKYGSVQVYVQLNGTTDEDTITVWSAVLNLPAKDEPRLLRYLLELNCSSTFEARFGIIENKVVVISTRTLAELSPGEVSRLITIVATIADNNDEALQTEFGAT
ncbi:MAG: YbjN domain-containing protein [Nostoc sp.]|uniref:YbjN domain-containing protein n=1 Tax=unclassified Nostoc TaxID=2593658 RepID=UPI0016899D99|nr:MULTISPECIES: YbjN domain-containing protein [unclassified Nostoc]MBD2524494.1 YbjN domain-containing protein [Nostoc sp. FACHB-133]MBE8985860.1 YbjN domain-containing protein [Nostoc sp. LEGE 12450]MBE9000696.1 YbjN domain-containing protein [Nostoc sp. LEGE 12447]